MLKYAVETFNPEVIKPPPPKNNAYYYLGLGLMFINKIRHSIKGYANPRTFKIIEYQRAIDYDFGVFDNWMKYLALYTGISPDIKGKTILELGPGADLGVGLITLLNGAQRYNAIDVNNLVESVPDRFYLEFFKFIKNKYSAPDETIDYLYSQLRMTQKGKNERLIEYWNILKKHGWSKVVIIPLTVADDSYLARINDHLAKRFQESINQMDYLTIMLCGTKV